MDGAPENFAGQKNWRDNSNCKNTDPELFFDKSAEAQQEVAQKYCFGCKVVSFCLDFSLAFDARYGVYGGLTEEQRKKLRESQKISKEAL